MLSDAIALLNLSFNIRHTYAHNQNDFICTTGPMYHQLAQYQWLLVLIVTWTWKASITLHMKELLRNEIYEQFKASWKYYDYFQQINEYYPFLVFRLLQSQYKMIFEQQKEEVIKLYSSYIKFANTRRNSILCTIQLN